jgi:hypothetical protein
MLWRAFIHGPGILLHRIFGWGFSWFAFKAIGNETVGEASNRRVGHHTCFIALANFCGGNVFNTSSLVSQARRA